MNFLKKWIPFIILISIALITSIYLLNSQQQAVYAPATNDPAIIFRDACAHCHGVEGQGEGLLYPDLISRNISPNEIELIISEGALFMPAFKSIKGDTLSALTEYVYNKKFYKIHNQK